MAESWSGPNENEDDEGQNELDPREDDENGEYLFQFPVQNCSHCDGYYGQCHGQHSCPTCHLFLFPDYLEETCPTDFTQVFFLSFFELSNSIVINPHCSTDQNWWWGFWEWWTVRFDITCRWKRIWFGFDWAKDSIGPSQAVIQNWQVLLHILIVFGSNLIEFIGFCTKLKDWLNGCRYCQLHEWKTWIPRPQTSTFYHPKVQSLILMILT